MAPIASASTLRIFSTSTVLATGPSIGGDASASANNHDGADELNDAEPRIDGMSILSRQRGGLALSPIGPYSYPPYENATRWPFPSRGAIGNRDCQCEAATNRRTAIISITEGGDPATDASLGWTIGAVTVRRLVEIEMEIPYDADQPFIADATPAALADMPWLCPAFVTASGALRLSIHSLLVEAPGLRLLVDTCVGNDRPRDFICREPLQTAYLAHLTALGWPPETVDTVLCTHLHVDHVGWNTRLVDGAWIPTFPNARYLIGHAEHDSYGYRGTAEHAAIYAECIEPLRQAGQIDLVASDHRLSDEIRLFPTPGHTPGHVSVMIESEGQRAVITGDAIHHPLQMTHPDWAPPWEFDQEVSYGSRRALLDGVADRPVLVIGTHFAAPTAGHVRRDGTVYRFESGTVL